MDDADRLREAGDLWGALERFQAANQIMNVPTTGLELARVQAAILQLVEARDSALSAARLPVTKGEPKAFADARVAANGLAAEVAPRIPDLTVFVEPSVAGGRVSIDGVALPRLPRPLPFKLNPGAHMVAVEASGYVSRSEQISLAERQHAELRITLTPSPRALPAVAAQPVATVPAQPAATAATPREMDDPNRAGRTRGYVAIVAGGAVLAAGVVTGILSATKTNSLKDMCAGYNCPPSSQATIDTANTLATVANITIPLGLVGIGYGVFELLTHGSASTPERPSAAHLQISIGVRQPGLWIRGAL
jgi:hypothetical protein